MKTLLDFFGVGEDLMAYWADVSFILRTFAENTYEIGDSALWRLEAMTAASVVVVGSPLLKLRGLNYVNTSEHIVGCWLPELHKKEIQFV